MTAAAAMGRMVLVMVMLVGFGKSFAVLMDVDVLRYQWQLIDDNGILGVVSLKIDGTISGLTNTPSYSYWSWNAGTHLLTLARADKTESVRFVHAMKDQYGKWRLQGYYEGTGYAGNWMVHLEQLI